MTTFDRGAFAELRFSRCARGFTLNCYDIGRDDRTTFAFDRIEDLADWLVEQYENPPTGECRKQVA